MAANKRKFIAHLFPLGHRLWTITNKQAMALEANQIFNIDGLVTDTVLWVFPSNQFPLLIWCCFTGHCIKVCWKRIL